MGHPCDRLNNPVVEWGRTFVVGSSDYNVEDFEANDKTEQTLQATTADGRNVARPQLVSHITKIPKDDGSLGLEHLLMRTLKKFSAHVNKADLKDVKKFERFGQCLEGASERYWNEVLRGSKFRREEDRTDDNFKVAINELIRHVTNTKQSKNARDCIYYYLDHRKKAKAESPSEYLLRFNELIDIADQCEGQWQKPNSEQIKGYYYQAMPMAYRQEFVKNDKSLIKMSLDDVMNYFQKLHDADPLLQEEKNEKPAAKKRKADETDEEDSLHDSYDNDGDESEGPPKKKRRKRGTKSKSSNGRTASGDEPCPCGKGIPHSVNRCWLNSKGSNFRPDRYFEKYERRDATRGRDYDRGGRDHRDNYDRSRRDRPSDREDAHYHDNYYNGRSRSRSRSPERRRERSNRSSSRSRGNSSRSSRLSSSDNFYARDEDYERESRNNYYDQRQRVDRSMFG